MAKLSEPNDWARQFKLPHCIGNKSFARQIRKIQKEAYLKGREDSPAEAKKQLIELDDNQK